MKKQFLTNLANKLQTLSPAERDQVIKEYEQIFEEKRREGKKIKEIIEEFGDIDVLAQQIIDDKAANKCETKLDRFINFLTDKIITFFGDFAKLLSQPQGEKIIRIVINVLLLLLCLWLLKLPFLLIEGVGKIILFTVSRSFYSVFRFPWILLVRFIYFLIVIVIAYNFIRRMINNNKQKSTKSQMQVKLKDKKISSNNYLAMMFKPFLIVIKILAVIFMIPLFLLLIAILVGIGIMLALAFMGIHLWGPFLILFGLLLMGCAFLSIFYYLIFRKEEIK